MFNIITNLIDRKLCSLCFSVAGCGGSMPSAGAAHAVMALALTIGLFIRCGRACGCTGSVLFGGAVAGFESRARFLSLSGEGA